MKKLREIKVNLFPRVPIYVVGEGLPAIFRVSRHCHFYFRSAAGEERNEDRFAGSGSLSFAQRVFRRRHYFRRYFELARSSSYSSFNRERERNGFFASQSILQALRMNSRVIDIEGMCVIVIDRERERKKREGEAPRFLIRSYAVAVTMAMAANRRFQFRDVDRMNRSATVI